MRFFKLLVIAVSVLELEEEASSAEAGRGGRIKIKMVKIRRGRYFFCIDDFLLYQILASVYTKFKV